VHHQCLRGLEWVKHCFFPFLMVYMHIIYLFLQKWDVVDNLGSNSIQKCTVVLHIFTYWITSNVVDDYYHMWENTIMEASEVC
jgi:hypothetical protein